MTKPFMTETPEEREVFSAMEQSSVRKEGIRQMDKYQSIMEELSIARMLIRELGDRLAKLEKPLAAEKEREACALICDAVTQDMSLGPLEKYRATEIAKLIRAREKE
jgi:glutamate synthase domain-containing protein 2